MEEAFLRTQAEEKFLGNDIILPMQSFQSLLDARCGTNGRNPCPAGSEGSLLLPYSWKSLAHIGGRGVG